MCEKLTATTTLNMNSGLDELTDDTMYQYSPLECDQIRVVILEPGQSDPIRCRILTRDRQDAPSYEAVSYVWGDDTLTSNVQILPENYPEEKPTKLSIPQTCASVLLTLRSAYSPRILWIDAISMNQTDLSERSLQVRIMPRIYRSAKQVLICLASSSDDGTSAMEFISRGRFRNAAPEAVAAAKRLFRDPWFSRTWAIQEVARSRHDAVVLYNGHATAPWSNFALCASTLGLDVPVMSPIRRLRQRGWIDTLSTDQFVKAICEATACDCRDPRDRVFAFLSMYPTMMNASQIEKYRTSGFAAMPGERGEEARGKGEVVGRELEAAAAKETTEESTRGRMTNYAHSVETVYTQFAAMLLEILGLDFLSAMQGRSTTDTLPSWVPDWRVHSGRTILAHLPLTEFNAGGHRENQSFRILPVTAKVEMERLQVSAICLGDITSLGEACDVNRDGWEDIVFGQWRELAETARKASHAKECPARALSTFIQTVMTDSDDEFTEMRKTLWGRMTAKRQVENKKLLAGLDAEAVTKLRISCHGRRLFIGSNGTMGLVASESQERDLVAVLPGARLPYSFRHRYDLACADVALVGECFVHSMVRGEAWGRGNSSSQVEIRIY